MSGFWSVTGRRLVLLLATAAASACGADGASSDPTEPTAPTTPTSTQDGARASERCLVRLHGKGGTGAETITDGDVTVIAPTGNAEGWGARQWSYFPDDQYAEARAIVADAVEPCERVIINGFSNGASFAAKLYCRGETFDGRVIGIVVDDPVTDAAVVGCAPDPAVAPTLYWTGALEETAPPGWDCADGDWTCEGGSTIGIEAYAAALGTPPTTSPFTDHQWYVDAPEVSAW